MAVFALRLCVSRAVCFSLYPSSHGSLIVYFTWSMAEGSALNPILTRSGVMLVGVGVGGAKLAKVSSRFHTLLTRIV